MKHIFDVELAVEYGINCAIILENINYWICKNKANKENFHDGYYWTYNTIEAFHTLFPYLSGKQIRGALKKLEDEGLIITGNYNERGYDRTKWYALTDKGTWLLHSVITEYPKGQMDSDKRANGIVQKGKPIPNINTNINNIKSNNSINTIIPKKNGKNPNVTVQQIVDLFNDTCVSFPKVRSVSERRKQAVKARLNKYSLDEIKEAFNLCESSDFLKGSNNRNWIANFDWIMNDNNMAKILDGNYKNKTTNKQKTDDSWKGGQDFTDLDDLF